jgi:hypothetical protein
VLAKDAGSTEATGNVRKKPRTFRVGVAWAARL